MWKPKVNPQKLVFSFQKGLQTSHEKTQRKPQCTFLSERRQCEKATRCVIPTLGHSGTGKSHGDCEKISGLQGLVGRGHRQAEHRGVLGKENTLNYKGGYVIRGSSLGPNPQNVPLPGDTAEQVLPL